LYRISGHPEVFTAIIIINNNKKQLQRPLSIEMQRMWQVKSEVVVGAYFFFGKGALGTIKKRMVENIKMVSQRATVIATQKISTFGSARILRKVLTV